jgi:diadenosine tetraphosphate (Ap4A) HIT family hydrolase
VLVGIVAVIDFCRNISDGVRPLIPSCSLASLYALTNISYLSDDRYPVVKDHSLIVPIRHIYSFFNLGTAEQKACFKLLEEQKDGLKKDSSISGLNIGINDGIDAGQTILHCPIHLIPRRKGDVIDPRGGLRHMIPDKGFYA